MSSRYLKNTLVRMAFFSVLFFVTYPSLAQISLGSFWKKRPDYCPGVSTIGATCPNGAKYLGEFDYGGKLGKKKLIMTPGGCTNSTTPTCDDSSDNNPNNGKRWEESPGNTVTNATSDNNGKENTAKIIAAGGQAKPAAEYCTNMIFAGLKEWYMPSPDEFAHIRTNRSALNESSFGCSYWTSKENTNDNAITAGRDNIYCNDSTMGKTNINLVRCILRY